MKLIIIHYHWAIWMKCFCITACKSVHKMLTIQKKLRHPCISSYMDRRYYLHSYRLYKWEVSIRRVIKDSDIEFEKNCNQETNSVYIRTAQKGTTFIFRAHNPLATRKCCNWQKLIAENVQLYVSTQLLNSCRAIEYFNCVHIVG